MRSFQTYQISAEHAGITVEHYLKQVLHYSGRSIQKLTRQKGILLNGKTVYLQKKVKPQDTLRVLSPQDQDYGVKPEKGEVMVLYEDAHMLVLNKPARQLVHPAGQTTSGTLANYAAHYLAEQGIISRIRPVHRLDRNTSGCVIFAKNAQSQFLLEQQIKARTLRREYCALVKGSVEPPSGTVSAPIGPHSSLPNRRAVTEQGDPAVTHYHTLRSLPGATLLKLTLDTGRTHQIRVHMAHLGNPIIGDGMYGVHSSWISRQALHAASVTFHKLTDHRVVTVRAPFPPDFLQALSEIETRRPTST